MAKAFKCDRCGSLYAKNEIENIRFCATTGVYGNKMDLCDECIMKLTLFMQRTDIFLCERDTGGVYSRVNIPAKKELSS